MHQYADGESKNIEHANANINEGKSMSLYIRPSFPSLYTTSRERETVSLLCHKDMNLFHVSLVLP
jgi:hypothetical protein